MLEYMPEMSKNFKFDQVAFEKTFNEFDDDGSGTVSKQEMAGFIQRILQNDTASQDSDKNGDLTV